MSYITWHCPGCDRLITEDHDIDDAAEQWCSVECKNTNGDKSEAGKLRAQIAALTAERDEAETKIARLREALEKIRDQHRVYGSTGWERCGACGMPCGEEELEEPIHLDYCPVAIARVALDDGKREEK